MAQGWCLRTRNDDGDRSGASLFPWTAHPHQGSLVWAHLLVISWVLPCIFSLHLHSWGAPRAAAEDPSQVFRFQFRKVERMNGWGEGKSLGENGEKSPQLFSSQDILWVCFTEHPSQTSFHFYLGGCLIRVCHLTRLWPYLLLFTIESLSLCQGQYYLFKEGINEGFLFCFHPYTDGVRTRSREHPWAGSRPGVGVLGSWSDKLRDTQSTSSGKRRHLGRGAPGSFYREVTPS